MKRSLVFLATLAMTAFTLADAVSADTIDQRQYRQHVRIGAAARHGELTRGEFRRLHRGQAHVRRMEFRARRDGRMTTYERRRMHRALDRQSFRIHRMSHNRRTV